jgi:predicted DNA-binding protein with PD1-like motif
MSPGRHYGLVKNRNIYRQKCFTPMTPPRPRYSRSMRSIAFIALLAAALTAQQTHKEVTNPGPRDSQPNDPKVPDAYAISTQFDRVLILRFKYQTDLLDGLKRMVQQNHVRNAVILNGMGSVISYQVHQVSNRTFPSKNMYVADPTKPADIVSMSGYVLNGQLHPHIGLADPDRQFGGHLEPGTKVFTFAIVTLGVLPDGLDLSKLDDKNYR